MFGETFNAPARRLPLFPTAAGSPLSKMAVVDALRACIAALGEPLTRPDGMGVLRDRYGEHVCRVAGAQLLSRAGMDLYLVQLFARWGSSAVLRYV
eukprot:16094490-Heterocapsa_arctica.AAC.1